MFTLVAGYQAVAGQTIQPSQHNPPLLDIAQALTNSLPRDGSAPMTAQLKMIDGTAGTPALGFGSTAGVGLFKSTNGIGFAVGGTQVAEIGATGFLAGIPIGGGVDFFGTAAPAGWLFPYGQAISRTTYAALWAAMGSPNTGDGSTTFTLPDKRGRASFGKDDMGGTAANRIQVQTTISTTSGGASATVASAAGLAIGMTVTSTNIPAGTKINDIAGVTLTLSANASATASGTAARFSMLGDAQSIGSAGGEQAHQLRLKEMASHNHSGNTDVAPDHTHGVNASGSNAVVSTTTNNVTVPLASNNNTGAAGAHSHSFTTSSVGNDLAHNVLPPGIVCNYIIFAGA